MDKLAHLNAQLVGGARRETRNGVEYVVAPAVMCRHKVLNDWLMTREALAASVGDLIDTPENPTNLWEGLPINIDHPPKSLRSISAIAQWCESKPIGSIENSQLVDGHKLVASLVFPVEQTTEAGREVVQAIESGDLIDVSVGVHASLVAVSGTFEEEEYSAATIDIAPFHLAVLPGKVGACSSKQGCGTPLLAALKTPTYSGVEETPWRNVHREYLDYYWAAYGALAKAGKVTQEDLPDDPQDLTKVPLAMREWIAERTLLGDARAESIDKLLFYPVVNPATDALNRSALFALLGARAMQAAADDKTKRKARELALQLLEDEFGMPNSITAELSTEVCGKRLGKVLSAILTVKSSSDDERSKYVQRIASAADLSTEKVESLLGGEGEVVPEDVINAFASVLNVERSTLYVAADSDLRAFMRDIDEAEGVDTAPGFFERLAARLKPHFSGGENDDDKGGNKVEKKELIAALGAELSDAEKAALDSLDEAVLEKLVAARKDAASSEGKGEGSQEPAGNEPPAGETSQVSGLDKLMARLDRIDKRLDASLSAIEAEDQRKRERAVAACKTANLDLSDDEIEAMPTAALEKIARRMQPANYVGRGGAITTEAASVDDRKKAREGVESPAQIMARTASHDHHSGASGIRRAKAN